MGHTTQHRLVQRQEFEMPDPKQAVSEVSIDGGKVRLRGAKGEKSYWRDYKGVREHSAFITVLSSKTTSG